MYMVCMFSGIDIWCIYIQYWPLYRVVFCIELAESATPALDWNCHHTHNGFTGYDAALYSLCINLICINFLLLRHIESTQLDLLWSFRRKRHVKNAPTKQDMFRLFLPSADHFEYFTRGVMKQEGAAIIVELLCQTDTPVAPLLCFW